MTPNLCNHCNVSPPLHPNIHPQCPPGTYGATQGLATATCSGPCDPGTFGNTSGLTSSACSGNCSAGFACPPGSTNATVTLCPPGTYSPGGQGSCLLCPGGRFGTISGATLSSCGGSCSPGYACPPGSTNATVALCPPGTYSAGSMDTCANCSAGFSCRAGSTSSSPAVDVCPPGTYGPGGAVTCWNCSAGFAGPDPGNSDASCGGPCRAGQYSLEGASSCSLCPQGMACALCLALALAPYLFLSPPQCAVLVTQYCFAWQGVTAMLLA
jgi:hypothetical protein